MRCGHATGATLDNRPQPPVQPGARAWLAHDEVTTRNGTPRALEAYVNAGSKARRERDELPASVSARRKPLRMDTTGGRPSRRGRKLAAGGADGDLAGRSPIRLGVVRWTLLSRKKVMYEQQQRDGKAQRSWKAGVAAAHCCDRRDQCPVGRAQPRRHVLQGG